MPINHLFKYNTDNDVVSCTDCGRTFIPIYGEKVCDACLCNIWEEIELKGENNDN